MEKLLWYPRISLINLKDSYKKSVMSKKIFKLKNNFSHWSSNRLKKRRLLNSKDHLLNSNIFVD